MQYRIIIISFKVLEDIIKYMIDFCMKNNVQVEAIQDELDGIMNDEFDTICEDESTKGMV